MQKEFNFSSKAENLPPFRQELRSLLGNLGFDEETRNKVLLAVDEALTNVVRHSYKDGEGNIKVLVRDHKDRIEVEVHDSGPEFDPTTIPEPELPPKNPGGLGVFFMRSIMDEVKHHYDSGNRLIMTKLKHKERN